MKRLLTFLPLLLIAGSVAAGTIPLLNAGSATSSAPAGTCSYGSAVADGCAGASATNSFQQSNFFSTANQSSQTYQTASFTGSVSGGVLTATGITGTIRVNDTLVAAGIPAGVVAASGAAGTWTLTKNGAAAPTFSAPSQAMTTRARPPWNVAAVDYPVGIDLSAIPGGGGALRDPNTITTLTVPHCAWAATNGSSGNGQVTCTSDSGGGVTIDGYDFSLHGCTALSIASSVTGPVTIRNSKFIAGGAARFTGSITAGTMNITVPASGFGTVAVGQYLKGTGIPTGTTIVSGSGTTWVTSSPGTTVGSETITSGNGSCGLELTFQNINIAGGSTITFNNNYVNGCVLLSGTTGSSECSASQVANNLNANFIVVNTAPTGALTFGPYNVFLNTSRGVSYTGTKDFTWKWNYGEQTGNTAAHGEQALIQFDGTIASPTPTMTNFTWLYSTYLGPAAGLTQGTTAPIAVYEKAMPIAGTGAGNTAAITSSGTVLTISGACSNGTPIGSGFKAGMKLMTNTGSTTNQYTIASVNTGSGCAGTYTLSGNSANYSGAVHASFTILTNVDIEGNTIIQNCALSAGGCGNGNPSVIAGQAIGFDWAGTFSNVTLANNYIDPTGLFRCWAADTFSKITTLTMTNNVNMKTGYGADASINAWNGYSTGTCTGHGP